MDMYIALYPTMIFSLILAFNMRETETKLCVAFMYHECWQLGFNQVISHLPNLLTHLDI